PGDGPGTASRRLDRPDPAQPRRRDAQASARGRGAASAEGADQDALPPRLHDLPGHVRRHPRTGRHFHLPRAQRLMSVPTVPMPESASQPEPLSEASAAVERRPLRELLPTGGVAVLVAVLSLAAVVASFTHFGVTGQALVGAVLCPTLILLAAIDLKHRLLPNTIVLPATLAVGLIVAASSPHDLLAHFLAGLALGGFF